eukprot:SAG31_NODE_166_length_21670_cov_22.507719_7_plen_41_part_00
MKKYENVYKFLPVLNLVRYLPIGKDHSSASAYEQRAAVEY